MWPLQPLSTRYVSATRTNASVRTSTTITTGTTAHVKTAWVSLLDPVPEPGGLSIDIHVTGITFVTGTDTGSLLDIAVGPTGGGSEQVIIPNLQIGYRDVDGMPAWHIPVRIPSGCRISGRVQTARAAAVAFPISIDVHGGHPAAGVSVPQRWVDIGTSTAASAGTAVTPSGTNNAKGSWTNIGSVTTTPLNMLLPMIAGSGASMVLADMLADFGAGSTVLIPDVSFNTTAAERVNPRDIEMLNAQQVGFEIPVGTQMQARLQSSNANSARLSLLGGVF